MSAGAVHPAVRFLRRWLRRFIGVVAVPLALLILWGIAWTRQVAPADPAAREGLDSDPVVAVSRGDYYVFRPKDDDPVTGLIFYPGGKADPVAYAPILHRIAADGVLVVLTPMPLNLALLAPDRAMDVMGRFPQIEHWVVAGHSLGGVAAAQFAAGHPDKVAGLVLWASWPGPFTDLSKRRLTALSIFGTRDAFVPAERMAEARSRMPAGTTWVSVAGGDHWNFGHFASGQGTATITRGEQQNQVVDAVDAFLRGISPKASREGRK